MNAFFKENKLFALRGTVFVLLALYCGFMLDILNFNTTFLFEAEGFYHLSGIKFFVMVVFFFPFIALLAEIETVVIKKYGLEQD